jgi:hypothetical protein
VRHCLAGALAGRDADDLEGRVRAEQAKELASAESGCSEDGRAEGHLVSICIVTHEHANGPNDPFGLGGTGPAGAACHNLRAAIIE